MGRIASILSTAAVLLCLSGFPVFGQVQEPGRPGQPGNGNPPPTVPEPGQQQPAQPGQQPETGVPGTDSTPKAMQQNASQMVAQNPKLVTELEPLLPSGTNVPAAASGFTSLHKFVTTVHVSHNLQIPFSKLKTKAMTGSLNKAIKDLKPNMNQKSVKSQIKTASKQAKQDIKQSKS